jgi:hypothetical protein
MDVQTSEKMGDRSSLDEDVQIVEAHIEKGTRAQARPIMVRGPL